MTVPPGYTALARGWVRAVIRDDLVQALGGWLLDPVLRRPANGEAVRGGRGGAFRLRAGEGSSVVVRPLRRGGWVARVVAETYAGWSPRPFRELQVSLAARERGVATPAVVAVRVAGQGVYRGAVVTEEVADARTVAEALRCGADAAHRTQWAEEAGCAVARLYAADVAHPDLNLHNLLVPRVGPGPVTVLDLDRARLCRPDRRGVVRRRGLARLRRSWLRVTGESAVPSDVENAFRRGWARSGGGPCGS